MGRDDFTKIPNGGPGVEHRMSLIYSGGVAGGRFSVNRFVELVSTTPAKLFGLYPRKGTIAVGSDADLVIFDPKRKHTISAKTHHMRVDYSMFEGIEVTGMPDVVLSRGKVIVDGDKFLGRAGTAENSCGAPPTLKSMDEDQRRALYRAFFHRALSISQQTLALWPLSDRGLPVLRDCARHPQRSGDRQPSCPASIRSRFDFDVVIAPSRSNAGIERHAHRHGIRKADSVFSGLRFLMLSAHGCCTRWRNGQAWF